MNPMNVCFVTKKMVSTTEGIPPAREGSAEWLLWRLEINKVKFLKDAVDKKPAFLLFL